MAENLGTVNLEINADLSNIKKALEDIEKQTIDSQKKINSQIKELDNEIKVSKLKMVIEINEAKARGETKTNIKEIEIKYYKEIEDSLRKKLKLLEESGAEEIKILKTKQEIQNAVIKQIKVIEDQTIDSQKRINTQLKELDNEVKVSRLKMWKEMDEARARGETNVDMRKIEAKYQKEIEDSLRKKLKLLKESDAEELKILKTEREIQNAVTRQVEDRAFLSDRILEGLSAKYGTMSDKLSGIKNIFDKIGISVGPLGPALNKIFNVKSDSIKDVKDNLKNLNDKELKDFHDKLNNIKGDNLGEIDEYLKKIGASSKEGSSLLNKMSSNLGLIAAFSGAIYALGKAFTYLFETISKGLELTSQLEYGVAKTLSLMGEVDRVKFGEQYTEGIKRIHQETGESLETLSEGLYNLISSGIKAEDALNALEVATKGAVAGSGNADQAVDILTTSLNAFADQGINAEQAMDLIFTAVNKGKTDLAELSQSFGNVASTADMMGVAMGDALGMIAQLTLKGIKTPEAITSINSLLKDFSNPEKIKNFEKFGISVLDAGGKIRNIGDIFEDVRKSGIDFSQALNLSALSLDNEAKKAFSVFSTGEISLKEFLKDFDISKVTGAMSETYSVIADTTVQAEKRMSASWDIFAMNLASKVQPAVKSVSRIMGSLLESLADWTTANDVLAKQNADLSNSYNIQANTLRNLLEEYKVVVSSDLDTTDILGRIGKVSPELVANLQAINQALGGTDEELNKVNEEFKKFIDSADLLAETEALEALSKMDSVLREITDTSINYGLIVNKLSTSLNIDYKEMASPFQRLLKDLDEISKIKLGNLTNLNIELFSTGQAKLGKEILDITEDMEKARARGDIKEEAKLARERLEKITEIKKQESSIQQIAMHLLTKYKDLNEAKRIALDYTKEQVVNQKLVNYLNEAETKKQQEKVNTINKSLGIQLNLNAGNKYELSTINAITEALNQNITSEKGKLEVIKQVLIARKKELEAMKSAAIQNVSNLPSLQAIGAYYDKKTNQIIAKNAYLLDSVEKGVLEGINKSLLLLTDNIETIDKDISSVDTKLKDISKGKTDIKVNVKPKLDKKFTDDLVKDIKDILDNIKKIMEDAEFKASTYGTKIEEAIAKNLEEEKNTLERIQDELEKGRERLADERRKLEEYNKVKDPKEKDKMAIPVSKAEIAKQEALLKEQEDKFIQHEKNKNDKLKEDTALYTKLKQKEAQTVKEIMDKEFQEVQGMQEKIKNSQQKISAETLADKKKNLDDVYQAEKKQIEDRLKEYEKELVEYKKFLGGKLDTDSQVKADAIKNKKGEYLALKELAERNKKEIAALEQKAVEDFDKLTNSIQKNIESLAKTDEIAGFTEEYKNLSDQLAETTKQYKELAKAGVLTNEQAEQYDITIKELTNTLNGLTLASKVQKKVTEPIQERLKTQGISLTEKGEVTQTPIKESEKDIAKINEEYKKYNDQINIAIQEYNKLGTTISDKQKAELKGLKDLQDNLVKVKEIEIENAKKAEIIRGNRDKLDKISEKERHIQLLKELAIAQETAKKKRELTDEERKNLLKNLEIAEKETQGNKEKITAIKSVVDWEKEYLSERKVILEENLKNTTDEIEQLKLKNELTSIDIQLLQTENELLYKNNEIVDDGLLAEEQRQLKIRENLALERAKQEKKRDLTESEKRDIIEVQKLEKSKSDQAISFYEKELELLNRSKEEINKKIKGISEGIEKTKLQGDLDQVDLEILQLQNSKLFSIVENRELELLAEKEKALEIKKNQRLEEERGRLKHDLSEEESKAILSNFKIMDDTGKKEVLYTDLINQNLENKKKILEENLKNEKDAVEQAKLSNQIGEIDLIIQKNKNDLLIEESEISKRQKEMKEIDANISEENLNKEIELEKKKGELLRELTDAERVTIVLTYLEKEKQLLEEKKQKLDEIALLEQDDAKKKEITIEKKKIELELLKKSNEIIQTMDEKEIKVFDALQKQIELNEKILDNKIRGLTDITDEVELEKKKSALYEEHKKKQEELLNKQIASLNASKKNLEDIIKITEENAKQAGMSEKEIQSLEVINKLQEKLYVVEEKIVNSEGRLVDLKNLGRIASQKDIDLIKARIAYLDKEMGYLEQKEDFNSTGLDYYKDQDKIQKILLDKENELKKLRGLATEEGLKAKVGSKERLDAETNILDINIQLLDIEKKRKELNEKWLVDTIKLSNNISSIAGAMTSVSDNIHAGIQDFQDLNKNVGDIGKTLTQIGNATEDKSVQMAGAIFEAWESVGNLIGSIFGIKTAEEIEAERTEAIKYENELYRIQLDYIEKINDAQANLTEKKISFGLDTQTDLENLNLIQSALDDIEKVEIKVDQDRIGEAVKAIREWNKSLDETTKKNLINNLVLDEGIRYIDLYKAGMSEAELAQSGIKGELVESNSLLNSANALIEEENRLKIEQAEREKEINTKLADQDLSTSHRAWLEGELVKSTEYYNNLIDQNLKAQEAITKQLEKQTKQQEALISLAEKGIELQKIQGNYTSSQALIEEQRILYQKLTNKEWIEAQTKNLGLAEKANWWAEKGLEIQKLSIQIAEAQKQEKYDQIEIWQTQADYAVRIFEVENDRKALDYERQAKSQTYLESQKILLKVLYDSAQTTEERYELANKILDVEEKLKISYQDVRDSMLSQVDLWQTQADYDIRIFEIAKGRVALDWERQILTSKYLESQRSVLQTLYKSAQTTEEAYELANKILDVEERLKETYEDSINAQLDFSQKNLDYQLELAEYQKGSELTEQERLAISTQYLDQQESLLNQLREYAVTDDEKLNIESQLLDIAKLRRAETEEEQEVEEKTNDILQNKLNLVKAELENALDIAELEKGSELTEEERINISKSYYNQELQVLNLMLEEEKLRLSQAKTESKQIEIKTKIEDIEGQILEIGLAQVLSAKGINDLNDERLSLIKAELENELKKAELQKGSNLTDEEKLNISKKYYDQQIQILNAMLAQQQVKLISANTDEEQIEINQEIESIEGQILDIQLAQVQAEKELNDLNDERLSLIKAELDNVLKEAELKKGSSLTEEERINLSKQYYDQQLGILNAMLEQQRIKLDSLTDEESRIDTQLEIENLEGQILDIYLAQVKAKEDLNKENDKENNALKESYKQLQRIRAEGNVKGFSVQLQQQEELAKQNVLKTAKESGVDTENLAKLLGLPLMQEGGFTGQNMALAHPNEFIIPIEKMKNLTTTINNSMQNSIVINMNINGNNGTDIVSKIKKEMPDLLNSTLKNIGGQGLKSLVY